MVSQNSLLYYTVVSKTTSCIFVSHSSREGSFTSEHLPPGFPSYILPLINAAMLLWQGNRFVSDKMVASCRARSGYTDPERGPNVSRFIPYIPLMDFSGSAALQYRQILLWFYCDSVAV
jgi:hypothetical protein